MHSLLYRFPDSPQRFFRALYFRFLATDGLRHLRSLRNENKGRAYSLHAFDTYRCIFIRIPKCASRSIARSLFGNLAGGHAEIWKYRMVFNPSEFATYFKFAFVRNPWDRLLSAYLFLKKGGLHDRDRAWATRHLAPYPDFESFVRGWVSPDRVRSWRHFRPQCDFICDGHRKPALDFIGRFENIASDFARVAKQLGIEAELQNLNAGPRRDKDYHQYYSDTTAQIVAEVYQEDIELLGYSFDPP